MKCKPRDESIIKQVPNSTREQRGVSNKDKHFGGWPRERLKTAATTVLFLLLIAFTQPMLKGSNLTERRLV
jgi:hypothetical protein